MAHSYDNASLFVPFVDIPVRLGSLFQGIASIYDRSYLSRLNKLLRKIKSSLRSGAIPAITFLLPTIEVHSI